MKKFFLMLFGIIFIFIGVISILGSVLYLICGNFGGAASSIGIASINLFIGWFLIGRPMSKSELMTLTGASSKATNDQTLVTEPSATPYDYEQVTPPSTSTTITEEEGTTSDIPLRLDTYVEKPKMKTYLYSKKRAFVNRYVVLDLETTGLLPEYNEIIEIGAVRFVNCDIIEEFDCLIKPKQPISGFITDHTMITNDMVKNASAIEDKLLSLMEFIGSDVIVAHNASVNAKFLLANLDRHLPDYEFKNQVTDTLSMAKKYLPFLKDHKLPTIKQYLNMKPVDSHRAVDNCKVTGFLYWKCKMLAQNS